jgi:ubiquinone/menaquinone biosynthesis C-methylase UbiE
LTNVRFEHGDAQVHRFTPGAGDVALSRFGVMFFADPAPAFANIARGLRPGGRLVFVCWQNPPDRVLEIGFGPGLAIAELSRRVGDSGHVYGIDHSEVMLRQATRRNASAIAAGRVSLSRASVDQLPPSLGGPFDAILTVNSLGFWPAPTERLDELRRRLRPGGHITIASQPRCPGATASTSRNAAREIEALLQDAGYTKTRTETLDLDPPVVCILAVNPDPARDRSSPASDPTS